MEEPSRGTTEASTTIEVQSLPPLLQPGEDPDLTRESPNLPSIAAQVTSKIFY